jgi:hypothetical protein
MRAVMVSFAGSAAALIAVYLLVSYVVADFGWMRGMFSEWSAGARAFFAYVALAIGMIGAIIGGAVGDLS